MDPHLIELPRKIIVGKKVIRKVSEVCSDLGISGSALVLTGPTTQKYADDMLKRLKMEHHKEIVHSASEEEVRRIESLAKRFDVVLCVGGGKVIDIGKIVAFRKNIPFLSIPTAPSHDGIASERVSIKDGVGNKHSIEGRPPIAIVSDIKILRNAPYRLIASGCADIISNRTAVNDWRLGKHKGEYFSEYAVDLALHASEIVIRSGDQIRRRDERGIRNLVEAIITSGISMSMAKSSRPASGAEHMFSHALDMLGSSALHGEQCGVGSILMAYLQGDDWQKIKKALESVSAPTTIKHLGITEEMAIEALLKARKIRKRYTVLDTIRFNKDKAFEVLRKTGVVE